MSLAKRNSPFANAALVVTVAGADFGPAARGPLAGIDFQRRIEEAAFERGGGGFRALQSVQSIFSLAASAALCRSRATPWRGARRIR